MSIITMDNTSCASTEANSSLSSSFGDSYKPGSVVRFADESSYQIIMIDDDADDYDDDRESDFRQQGDESPLLHQQQEDQRRSSSSSSLSEPHDPIEVAERRQQRRQDADLCKQQGFGFLLMHALEVHDNRNGKDDDNENETSAATSDTSHYSHHHNVQRYLNTFVQLPEPYCGRGLERQISRKHDMQRKEWRTQCIQNVLAEENRLRFGRCYDTRIIQQSRNQKQEISLEVDKIWKALSKKSKKASKSSKRFARRMGKADELVVNQGELQDLHKAGIMINHIKAQEKKKKLQNLYTFDGSDSRSGGDSYCGNSTNGSTNNRNKNIDRGNYYKPYSDISSLSLVQHMRVGMKNQRRSKSMRQLVKEHSDILSDPSMDDTSTVRRSNGKKKVAAHRILEDKLIASSDIDDASLKTASARKKRSKSATRGLTKRWSSFKRLAIVEKEENSNEEVDVESKRPEYRISEMDKSSPNETVTPPPSSTIKRTNLLRRCYSWTTSNNSGNQNIKFDASLVDVRKSNSDRKPKPSSKKHDPFDGTSVDDDMDSSLDFLSFAADRNEEVSSIAGFNDSIQISKKRTRRAKPARQGSLKKSLATLVEGDQSMNDSLNIGDLVGNAMEEINVTKENSGDASDDTTTMSSSRRENDWFPKAPPMTGHGNSSLGVLGERKFEKSPIKRANKKMAQLTKVETWALQRSCPSLMNSFFTSEAIARIEKEEEVLAKESVTNRSRGVSRTKSAATALDRPCIKAKTKTSALNRSRGISRTKSAATVLGRSCIKTAGPEKKRSGKMRRLISRWNSRSDLSRGTKEIIS